MIESNEAADTVLYRGIVHTVDEAHPRAQGVAVRGDRIACVGTNEEVARWIGPETRTIDLGGHTVIPGLIDSHVHMEWYGRYQQEIDLDGAQSYDEAVSRVEACVAGSAPGKWIFGHGWDQTDWKDSRLPSHAKLSAISPHNPVWLVRGDGHSGLANARAMEIAGIARHTPDPDGGEILKDPETGAATGVLVDRAMQLVAEHFPTASSEETAKHILKAADDAVAVGLTGVHDAGITYETVEIYKRLAGDRRLKPRVYAMLGGFDRFLDDYFRLEPIIGHAGHHFTMRSIKLAVDGAMGSRGALLFEDYSDRPGHRGIAVRDSRLIASIATEALKRGFQVNVHAIGDLGNHTVLNAFEEALGKHSKKDHRFRIEHVQLISVKDIPRFNRLGVIPSMQQTHATSDMAWTEDRIGPVRVKGNYAWRKLLDSGSILAGGSDLPIESINPLRSLYAAVTRQSPDGHPRDGWYPEERMSLEEALKSFTLWAAYAAFEETLKGSITPGKLADLVVFSKDIMRIPPEDLLSTQVMMTIVGGEIVYQTPESPC